MSEQPKHVLFLCTGNSARSIMGEALLNARSKNRAFIGHSAGSHPAGQVNPLTIELLQKSRIPTDGLRSKNWDEFARPDSPQARLRLYRLRQRRRRGVSAMARATGDGALGRRGSCRRRGR